jgi:hypothetical protein
MTNEYIDELAPVYEEFAVMPSRKHWKDFSWEEIESSGAGTPAFSFIKVEVAFRNPSWVKGVLASVTSKLQF